MRPHRNCSPLHWHSLSHIQSQSAWRGPPCNCKWRQETHLGQSLVPVQHDVLWLQIPINNPSFVKMLQSQENLKGDRILRKVYNVPVPTICHLVRNMSVLQKRQNLGQVEHCSVLHQHPLLLQLHEELPSREVLKDEVDLEQNTLNTFKGDNYIISAPETERRPSCHFRLEKPCLT